MLETSSLVSGGSPELRDLIRAQAEAVGISSNEFTIQIVTDDIGVFPKSALAAAIFPEAEGFPEHRRSQLRFLRSMLDESDLKLILVNEERAESELSRHGERAFACELRLALRHEARHFMNCGHGDIRAAIFDLTDMFSEIMLYPEPRPWDMFNSIRDGAFVTHVGDHGLSWAGMNALHLMLASLFKTDPLRRLPPRTNSLNGTRFS